MQEEREEQEEGDDEEAEEKKEAEVWMAATTNVHTLSHLRQQAIRVLDHNWLLLHTPQCAWKAVGEGPSSFSSETASSYVWWNVGLSLLGTALSHFLS